MDELIFLEIYKFSESLDFDLELEKSRKKLFLSFFFDLLSVGDRVGVPIEKEQWRSDSVRPFSEKDSAKESA